MKTLIITVAGLSSRFNKDLDENTLKCLYYTSSYKNSLLYQIVSKSDSFNEIIIVGGYKYSELEVFVNKELSQYRDRVKLVYNPYYEEYGSGYSFNLGIQNLSPSTDELTFAEGDLFFDQESFSMVTSSEFDAITINNEPIMANKAVVVYINNDNKINYLYNCSHGSLEIKEPFQAVYNSGQIWKFKDIKTLKNIASNLNMQELKGTNLEIIQKYFGDIPLDKLNIINMNTWVNCNTVNDYKKILKH